MPTTTAVPVPAAEAEEPPFSPTLVEELLRQFDKAVRARQLYLANNPSFLNALEKLRASFTPLWAQTDQLTLTVTDTAFVWSGVPVHQQTEKASDSLPWLFYKDGLREITLTKGFEAGEVDQLVEIIPTVRRGQADEDDLITILWEHEFACLSYRHVELAQEGAIPAAADDPGRYEASPGVAVEEPKAASEEARQESASNPETLKRSPDIVKLEDFDSTLYFLDEKEVEYIKQEIGREYAADLRHRVLLELLDILELQPSEQVRNETLQLLDQMVLNMLAAARFQSVAYLLREIAVVLERGKDIRPAERERLLSLPNRLGDPATLSQILQHLDEASVLPPPEDLGALFAELRGTALGTIFEWLGRTQSAQLRTLLEGAANRLAGANTAELVKLIASPDSAVALEAIKRAGSLKTAAAVAPLAKSLADPSRELRLAAATTLVEIGSPGAMQILERALADADRDIRVTAVRALGARVQRSALPKIEGIVKSKELRSADLTERMAFFEAYGSLCGDGGIGYLDGLLNGKSGLLGRKEDPEVRACAAIALGVIKSPKAKESLEKALGEKDVIVRNAVTRALRGGNA